MVRIAVISDTHIGKGARSPDLVPGTTSTHPRPFIPEFLKFVTNTNIAADYLVIPGDITDSGTPEEAELAAEVISKISDGLMIPNGNVIIIPGNHDANWAFEKIGTHPSYKSLRYNGVVQAKLCLESLCKAPFLSLREDDHVIFLGINSAANDAPGQSPHNGALAHETLEKLRELSGDLSQSPKLKVCVIHHHPRQYEDIAAYWSDYSIIENAAAFLRSINRANFDFLIHGHKHRPSFSVYTDTGAEMLPMLCAGSFSKTLPADYDGNAVNQFHLIEIEGRDSTNKTVFGKVMSWGFCGASGWKQSHAEHHGIDHFTPFGIYESKHFVRSHLEEALRKLAENAPHASILDAFNLHPFLRYQQPAVMREIIEHVCNANGYRRHGDTATRLRTLSSCLVGLHDLQSIQNSL